MADHPSTCEDSNQSKVVNSATEVKELSNISIDIDMPSTNDEECSSSDEIIILGKRKSSSNKQHDMMKRRKGDFMNVEDYQDKENLINSEYVDDDI